MKYQEPAKEARATESGLPVEVTHFDMLGKPWRAMVTYRCRACGFFGTRFAGGEGRHIARALRKVEANPYCEDCLLCRAGRCGFEAVGRCCVAGGRARTTEKQVPLFEDRGTIIDGFALLIAEATADAALWIERVGAAIPKADPVAVVFEPVPAAMARRELPVVAR